MFAELPFDSILKTGEPTTFTYNSNTVLQLRSPSTIQESIARSIGRFGKIVVSRPFGSSNFIVTVVPSADNRIALFRNGIESGLSNAGIKDFKFVESEGGTVSSQPGGLVSAASELIGDTTSGISTILWKGVKPLLPWIILAGAGYIGFQYYMAKMMVPKLGTNPKKKRKSRKKAK